MVSGGTTDSTSGGHHRRPGVIRASFDEISAADSTCYSAAAFVEWIKLETGSNGASRGAERTGAEKRTAPFDAVKLLFRTNSSTVHRQYPSDDRVLVLALTATYGIHRTFARNVTTMAFWTLQRGSRGDFSDGSIATVLQPRLERIQLFTEDQRIDGCVVAVDGRVSTSFTLSSPSPDQETLRAP